LLEHGQLDAAGNVLGPLEKGLFPRQHPGQYVSWLELSAKRDLLRGNFGDALERFARVVAVCCEGGFRRAVLSAQLNQAHVLILLNQIRLAEEVLGEAVAECRSAESLSARVRLAWLFRLARERARAQAGAVAAALAVRTMQPSLAGRQVSVEPVSEGLEDPSAGGVPPPLPPAGNFLAFFEDRALGVQWALARGDRGLAEQPFVELNATFAASDSLLIRARLHMVAARVAFERKNYEEAAALLEPACARLEHLGLKPELWEAWRTLRDCAARLGSPSDLVRGPGHGPSGFGLLLVGGIQAQAQAQPLLKSTFYTTTKTV
jgi:hypothetical protein